MSTSRPSPSVMLEVYEQAAREGATAVVSIHLSGDMSGTFESAQLAAREASIPVTAVDTRQVGIATGYAVLAAADVLDAGGSAEEAAEAARSRAAASSSLFYVDTLEYLRRGGRIGAAAALFGGALAVKPLLTIEDGVVATHEKVRTSARALSRLEELAVLAAERPAGGRVRRPPGQPGPGRPAHRAAGRTSRRQPLRPRGLVRGAGRRAGRARRPRHARGLRRAASSTGNRPQSGVSAPVSPQAAISGFPNGRVVPTLRRHGEPSSEPGAPGSRLPATRAAERRARRRPGPAAGRPDRAPAGPAGRRVRDAAHPHPGPARATVTGARTRAGPGSGPIRRPRRSSPHRGGTPPAGRAGAWPTRCRPRCGVAWLWGRPSSLSSRASSRWGSRSPAGG